MADANNNNASQTGGPNNNNDTPPQMTKDPMESPQGQPDNDAYGSHSLDTNDGVDSCSKQSRYNREHRHKVITEACERWTEIIENGVRNAKDATADPEKWVVEESFSSKSNIRLHQNYHDA